MSRILFVFVAVLAIAAQARADQCTSTLCASMQSMSHDLDCIAGQADSPCSATAQVIADLRASAANAQGALQDQYKSDATKLADLNRFFMSLSSAVDALDKAEASGDQNAIDAQLDVINGIRKQAHTEFRH